MRIGELARQAGVSTRTLRHYEALGLVTARRAANGYRDYGGAELRAVAEIRSLAELGFSLEETRPFVECLRAGHALSGSCPDSIAVAATTMPGSMTVALTHDLTTLLSIQIGAGGSAGASGGWERTSPAGMSAVR